MKTYQFDEEKLLSMFVGNDNLNPMFKQPWLSANGGLVCASDTHILIQVKAECLNKQYQPVGKLRAVPYVENCDYTLTLKDLDTAFKKVPKVAERVLVEKGKECPECDGCGSVTVEYELKSGRTIEIECDCPVCGGDGMEYNDRYKETGRMIPERFSTIRINHLNFGAEFLYILRDAMNAIGVNSVKVVSIGDTIPAVFRVDENIEILLMPRTTDSKDADAVIKMK